MKTAVIVNPRSQNGALGRKWPDLAKRLRNNIAFEQLETESAGDATRLARRALDEGADCVVAVGGDGTINEVTNGFFDGATAVRPQAKLGILPFGTGGDFRKTLELTDDFEQCANVIADGHSRVIDAGLLHYKTRDGDDETRAFINIASFGISGVVDRLVNESSKALGGKVSFFMASLRAGLQYSNKRVRLQFDGGTQDDDVLELDVYTVAVANGRYFGGGMLVAPDADLGDGHFDVVALGDFGMGDILRVSRKIYKGTHLQMEKVSQRRAKRLLASPVGDEVVEIDLDGETPGILPATFELLPNAIQVIVPAPTT